MLCIITVGIRTYDQEVVCLTPSWHRGQLSFSSLQSRYSKYRPAWLGLRWARYLCQVADNTKSSRMIGDAP